MSKLPVLRLTVIKSSYCPFFDSEMLTNRCIHPESPPDLKCSDPTPPSTCPMRGRDVLIQLNVPD